MLTLCELPETMQHTAFVLLVQDHRNILRFKDAFLSGPDIAIVLEYAPHSDLASYVESRYAVRFTPLYRLLSLLKNAAARRQAADHFPYDPQLNPRHLDGGGKMHLASAAHVCITQPAAHMYIMQRLLSHALASVNDLNLRSNLRSHGTEKCSSGDREPLPS